MAFSRFFKKKADNDPKSNTPKKTTKNLPQSNSSPAVGIGRGAPSDFVYHAEELDERLVTPSAAIGRPPVRIELPDVDCCRITLPQKRSSQLSKTLEEVLGDKDALAYLIPYLEVRGAVSLIRFWLEADTFRLSATGRYEHSEDSSGLCDQLEHPRRVDQVLHVCQEHIEEDSSCSSSLEVALSSSDRSGYCDQTSNQSSDISLSTLRQRHSDAHGHCRENNAVIQRHARSIKSNFTDTGVSDPQRGVCDRLSNFADCNLPPECSGTVRDHSWLTNGECVVPVACASPVSPEDDGLVSAAKSRSTQSLSSSFSLQESLRRSIERDAVAIFSKYLSPDCSNPISITEELRQDAVHKICREADQGVDFDCFTACQRFVFDLLNSEYFPEFRQSVYHCKHQIDVLTGSELSLADILYDDTSFSYFTEYMENERATEILQCFLDLDNFQHLVAQVYSHNNTFQTQGDAVILYDKYFSLQATRSLRFEDQIRKEVENNMSREDGVLLDCFATPRRIIYGYIERLYLPQFLKSDLYYKYLSDLINTVHFSQDVVIVARKRRGSDTNSERSGGSAGNDSIHKNTLLAMDTRGQHMKRAMNNIHDDMRIDSSLFDPDSLWQRPKTENKMTFGRVNELGQFISDFDPGPEQDKKGLGSLFAKRSDKSRTQEEMALQVAQMIINEITNTKPTLSED